MLFALKVNTYLNNMSIKRLLAIFTQKRVFSLFLCAACLPASLIIHVPLSELHGNRIDIYTSA